MKETTTVVFSALIAVVAGGATAFLFPESGPSAQVAEDSAGVDTQLAAFDGELAKLQALQDELERSVAALEASSGPVGASSRTAVGDVDAAVAQWMEAHLATRLQVAAADDDPAAAGPSSETTRLVDLLLGDEVDGLALYQEIVDKGLLDEVIAEIERQVELDPSNPDLVTKLGGAYLQKVFTVGVGPIAMEWSERADQTFDRALELDDEQWEARFLKAISLSNQPAFLGRSSEAIRQFEILMGQQEKKRPQGGFDQTYYYLGNMYLQSGDREKARATWQRGLALFPDSGQLQQQLEGGR